MSLKRAVLVDARRQGRAPHLASDFGLGGFGLRTSGFLMRILHGSKDARIRRSVLTVYAC